MTYYYKNYGDANVLEYGRIVDMMNSNDGIVSLIAINPLSDAEDSYCFGYLTVDTNDDWIDWNKVCACMGIDYDASDEIELALACIDYYSWDEFGYPCIYNAHDVYDCLKQSHVELDCIDNPWLDMMEGDE